VVSIAQAAQLSGLPPDDIRHYEATGVIPRAERGASGRRVFRVKEVRRLRLIRHARDLGFPIQDIKRLLWGRRSGGDEHE
jgi:MerR family copper efflux transcriptional regulator